MKRNIIISVIIGTLATYLPFWQWDGLQVAGALALSMLTVHVPEREVTIRENYVLHTSLEWKLSELFRGVGLKKEGEELRMDWSALPGKTARAKIGLKPGIKDPNKKFNYIEKLYPKDTSKPAFTPGGF